MTRMAGELDWAGEQTAIPFRSGTATRIQQPWYILVDAEGRTGIGDLLEQLVRVLLPVATDQKVGSSSPSERARSEASYRIRKGPFSLFWEPRWEPRAQGATGTC
jgi:hypothetical protein